MKNWKGNIGLMACVFLFVLGNLFSGSQSDPEEKVVIVCFLEGKAWNLEPEEKERRMDAPDQERCEFYHRYNILVLSFLCIKPKNQITASSEDLQAVFSPWSFQGRVAGIS